MARPSQFDRNEALEKSMNLFWDNGYCNTSLQQLSAGMDMRPGSLYAAFKNKRALFLEALQLYFERSSKAFNQRLNSQPSAIASLHYFFVQLVADLAQDVSGRGCLMINTATELADHDEEIRVMLDEMFARHEQSLLENLQQAQSEGDLAADKDPRALAQFLLMTVRGMRVYSQTRHSRAEFQQLADTALTTLK
jgi:TetR/AcrR family transcriptional repressor of nem operon